MIWNNFDNDYKVGLIDPYGLYDYPEVQFDPPGVITAKNHYRVDPQKAKESVRYVVSEGLVYRNDLITAIQENDTLYSDRTAMYRYAKGIEYFLHNCALTFNPRNWFGFCVCGYYPAKKVGRINDWAIRGWLYPKATKDSDIEKLKDELRSGGDIDSWLDCDHSTPYWTSLLELGFCGLKERAQRYKAEKQKKGQLDAKKTEFYDAIDIAFSAVLHWLDRYIEILAKYDDDKVREMYKALVNIRTKPPRTLYEVMLFSYLYHFASEYVDIIQVRTLGNIDDLYRPYYERDLAEGRLTRDQAKELVKYFFMTYAYQRNWHGQPATLGGTLINGQTAVNDLSFIMLEAYDECDILSPKLHVLISKNTPDEFLRKCVDMTRKGHSSMVFLNDDLFHDIWKKHYNASDLKTYRIGSSGCYNLICEDLANAPSHTRINLPKALDRLFEDEVALAGIKTFDDFKEAYLKKVFSIVKQCMKISGFYDSIAGDVNPAVIYSGASESALERAESMFMGGTKYNDTSIIVSCPTTVFDSLIMVKKFVFDKKLLSLAELKKVLDVNWEGYESLRQAVLADKDKWGNNIGWVDDIAVEVYSRITNCLNGQKNERNGKYFLCGDTIDYDVRFGFSVKATPDGRKSGEPLSKSLIANRGQDRNGVTALIQSVTKLPAIDMVFGAPFDYMLHPSVAKDAEGLNAVCGIIRTFFELGGYSFMGNIIDADTLLKAKLDPEHYKTLQVRLCGWSVYFADLRPEHQDMLIKQAVAL